MFQRRTATTKYSDGTPSKVEEEKELSSDSISFILFLIIITIVGMIAFMPDEDTSNSSRVTVCSKNFWGTHVCK